MTKGLVMTGEQARAYTFSTDTVDKRTKPVQTSDKEDYILCTGCESYFGVLETLFCNKLHNPIVDVRKHDQFEWNEQQGQTLVTLSGYNSLAFRLFLASILWRCAVCNTHTVHRFTLKDETVEALRLSLMECNKQKMNDLREVIEGKKMAFPFHFDLSTILERAHTIGKIVFMHPNADEEGFMVLNDYILTYQFHADTRLHKINEPINTSSSDNAVILKLVPIEAWNQILDNLKIKFATKAKSYLEREKKEYAPMVK